MTLIEDVKTSFDESRDEQTSDQGPVTILRDGGEDLAPGFNSMRIFYTNRLLAICRRGYRHHAGSTLPTKADDLITLTGHQMMPMLIGMVMQAFADGVMIGHQDDHQVKISFHFNIVDHLFTDESFRENSQKMAQGMAEDSEVLAWFAEFTSGGMDHLTHITGFAHREVNPTKVWDVWMLIGTACVCSCYLAGNKMGSTWKERDVLDGIEIATEEVPRGSEGANE